MEEVCSMEQDKVKDALVLRSVNPFPGYRTDQEDGKSPGKPGSVFIILRYRYAPEKINRINKNLTASRITRCYPSSGEIITRELILPCIRLKGLDNYEIIPVVQSFFKRNDLQLMDYRPLQGPERIKIFKTFKLMMGISLLNFISSRKMGIQSPYF